MECEQKYTKEIQHADAKMIFTKNDEKELKMQNIVTFVKKNVLTSQEI